MTEGLAKVLAHGASQRSASQMSRRILYVRIVAAIRAILRRFGVPLKYTVWFDAPACFQYRHLEDLIEALSTDNRLAVWVTVPEDCAPLPPGKGLRVAPASELLRERFSVVDLFLSTELSRRPWWFCSGIAVCMFHGVGPKLSYLRHPRVNEYDAIFAAGPATVDAIRSVAKPGLMVFPVGLPVMDAVLEQAASESKGVDGRRPILLYAPSWSATADMICVPEELLETLVSQSMFDVVIRPHPLLLNPERCGGRDYGRMFERITGGHVRLAASTSSSVYVEMLRASVLLSDISSVAFEFMLLRRPVVLFRPGPLLEFYDAGEYGAQLVNASWVVDDVAQVLPTLLQALAGSEAKSAAREELLGRSFFSPGEAVERAVSAIQLLLGLSPVRTAPAPRSSSYE